MKSLQHKFYYTPIVRDDILYLKLKRRGDKWQKIIAKKFLENAFFILQ